MNKRKIFLYIKGIAMIAIPLLLLILPVTFFDKGQSISLFELAGVKDYYSKGMTKACMHLIHFDFKGAAHYNKISFIVLPLLVFVWVKEGLNVYRQIEKLREKQSKIKAKLKQN